MADIKQFVTPDNLGSDFEIDTAVKEIKVNIDGVTLIRNADGKLEAAGDGVGVTKEYVDDLTAVDGVTVIRNAEGELVSVGEVSKEYVDELTAIDGVTIIRNADGELEVVDDSVVYNITELPEGATAPVATRVNALAAGAGAVASGLNSVAIGINAGASGIQSTALGINAVASGLQSTALGFNANTTKSRQVSIAPLSETTHLSATPRLLSGVKAPEVGQDAANKEYVDDLTAIDGTTIIRNAEGELEGTGASKEYVDDLTKVDGTTIIRNAEGELVASGGGGGGDSVVYNITELPEGATAPNATRDNALAAGVGAVASGARALAAGDNTSASGQDSAAIGSAAIASGNWGIAIGRQAVASENYSIALGVLANTTKIRQVSFATLDETTHLAATPRLLSGVAKPEVRQDAANKDYVDNYIKAKVEALPEGATLEDLITALKS